MRLASLVMVSTVAACGLFFAVKGNEPERAPDMRAGDDAARVARLEAELRGANEDRTKLGREAEELRDELRTLEDELARKPAAVVAAAPAPAPPPPPRETAVPRAPPNFLKIARGSLFTEKEQQELDAKVAAERYFPYNAYRGYRPYRASKVYAIGKEERAGSQLACKRDPLDADCLGTVASCAREPEGDECLGTEPYCARHPSATLCQGTEAFCKNSPTHASCTGTAYWCLLRKDAAECRGARDDCERSPRQDQCLGTVAYCSTQFDQRLCPREP